MSQVFATFVHLSILSRAFVGCNKRVELGLERDVGFLGLTSPFHVWKHLSTLPFLTQALVGCKKARREREV